MDSPPERVLSRDVFNTQSPHQLARSPGVLTERSTPASRPRLQTLGKSSDLKPKAEVENVVRVETRRSNVLTESANMSGNIGRPVFRQLKQSVSIICQHHQCY